MQKFINIFGQNNILIVFGIIVFIIIALIVVLILERRSANKYKQEFEKYDKLKREKEEVNDREVIAIQEEQIQKFEPITKEKKDVVYVTEEKTQDEAKKAIEEAAKKLVYEEKNDIIGPTFFEKMQEESSIISYDELVSSNIDIDKENDKVLEDEGNEPITMDELYGYKEENIISEEAEINVLNNNLVDKQKKESFAINTIDEDKLIDENSDEMIYYVNEESKKFKNSDVISPIYGVKRDVIIKKEYNELGETIDIKELDLEIRKTEEFLKELKKLKNKLD